MSAGAEATVNRTPPDRDAESPAEVKVSWLSLALIGVPPFCNSKVAVTGGEPPSGVATE